MIYYSEDGHETYGNLWKIIIFWVVYFTTLFQELDYIVLWKPIKMV
jgi:hypothetical protein